MLLYPDRLRPGITAITAADLHALGVRGLLLDVDNTLTKHGSQYLDPAVAAWLKDMQAQGIALTIVSNGWPRRVRPFATQVGLRSISFACKPSPLGFWRGARRLGLRRRQCAAVGDQVFTDIIGAHLAGVRSIQVLPIEPEPGPLLRFKRWLEGHILRRYQRRQDKRHE